MYPISQSFTIDLSDYPFSSEWKYLVKAESISEEEDVDSSRFSGSYELKKLELFLKHPVFDHSLLLHYWNKMRKRITKTDGYWVFYFLIDDKIYIIHFDKQPEFDRIYEEIRDLFPRLSSKYELRVKKIINRPSRVFHGRK
jgi:hypothetical protein